MSLSKLPNLYRFVGKFLNTKQDYNSNSFKTTINSIETELDVSKIDEEYEKEAFDKKLFLFIGRCNRKSVHGDEDSKDQAIEEDSIIQSKLREIEENNYIDDNDIPILNEYFGYDVEENWDIQNMDVFFIEETISKNDTFSFVLNLLGLFLKDILKIETIDNNSFLLLPVDSKLYKIRLILEKLLVKNINLGFNYTISMLIDDLKDYNLDETLLQKIALKYKDNIENILKSEIIAKLLELVVKHRPINFEMYYRGKKKEIDLYLGNYLENEINEANSEYLFKKVNNNMIMGDICKGNTLHFFLYENFRMYVDEKKKGGDILSVFFPFKKNIVENKLNMSFFSNHLKLNETYSRFKSSNSNVKLDFSNMLIYNIRKEIPIPNNLDMVTIFNNIKLSEDIPFCKFRDLINRQMVYKFYKKIFERKNDQYEYIVDEKQLSRWLKYKNYEIDTDTFKVIDLKTNPKCLLYKLKIDECKDNVFNNGEIIKINLLDTKVKLDIFSEGKIYENIPIDNLKLVDQDFTIGMNVEFRKNINVYADIEILKSGIINLNINISNYNTKDIINTIEIKFSNFLDKIFIAITEINKLDFLRRPLIEDSKIGYSVKIILETKYNLVNSRLTNLLLNYLYPLVYLHEEFFNQGQIILFNDSDGILKEGTILNRNITTEIKGENYSYDIKIGDKILKNINGKKILKKNKEDAGLLTFYFKKISNFEYSKPIKNHILVLQSLNLSYNMIIERLQKTFSLTYEQSVKHIEDIAKLQGITNLENISGTLNPKITIDFVDKINQSDSIEYNVYLENIKSNDMMLEIEKLLKFIIELYECPIINCSNLVKDLNEFLSKGEKENLEKEVSEAIDHVDEKSNENSFNTYNEDDDDDENYNLDDLGDISFSDDENDDEKNEIDDTNDVDELEEKEDEKMLKMEIDKEEFAMVREQNIVLSKLYEADPYIFGYRVETPEKIKKYSDSCQNAVRQPKVFTDKEKNEIDKRDHDFFTKNNLEIESSYKTSKNDKRECSKEDGIPKDMKCASIKYGSTNDKMNWYMCPKIYDVISHTTLHWKMLNYTEIDGKTFEPKDYNNIDSWRIDKNSGKDILEYNPTYMGRGVIKDIKKINYSSGNSLLLLEVGGGKNRSYPGFLNKNTHPDDQIYVPCCFNKISRNVNELIQKKKDKIYSTNPYIQSWGKKLGYLPKRIGLLPDHMNILLGNNIEDCVTGILKSHLYLRSGIKNDGESFLHALADMFNISIIKLKLAIVDNIDENIFRSLNNGTLELEFRTKGKQTSYQNFIEYTLSNQEKDFKHYYELISDFIFKQISINYSFDNDNLLDGPVQNFKPKTINNENGINLIIIDVLNGNNVICPFFQNPIWTYNRIKKKTLVGLLLKYDNYFEPIYFFKNDINIPIKIFNHQKTAVINNILNSFISNCMKFDNVPNYPIISLNDILKLLIFETNELEIKYLLRDNYNKIYGVLLKNNSVIPVYPGSIPPNILTEFIAIRTDKRGGNLNSNRLPILTIGQSNNNTNFKPDLISLDKHIDTYSKIKNLMMNKYNLDLNIYPVEYYGSNSILTGFKTNNGIYIDVLPEKKEDLKMEIYNYNVIDDIIAISQVKENKNSYKKPIKYSELIKIISKYDGIISDIDLYIKNYYKDDISKILVLVMNNGIIIPIEFEENIKLDEYILLKELEIENLNEYLNEIIKISQLTSFRIPLKIVGYLMNDEKVIDKIILETGLEINLNEPFNIKKMEGNEFLINNFLKDIFMIKSIDIVSSDLKMRELNYETNLEEGIKKKLYLLLREPEFKNIKFLIIKVLNIPNFNSIQRKIILFPIFEILFEFIASSKKINIYPSIDLEDVCEVTMDPTLCEIENIDMEKIKHLSENKNNYLQYSLNNIYKNSNYVGYSPIINEKIIEILELLKELIPKLNIPNYSRIKLKVDSDNYNKIRDNLFNDLIRNNYVKYQILVDFVKTISSNSRYETNKRNEILLLEEDLVDKTKILSLFEKVKKQYYNEMIHFGMIDLIPLEVDNQKTDDCTLVKEGITYEFKRLFIKKKLNITNIVDRNNKYLSSSEFEEIEKVISRKNTLGIEIIKIPQKLKYTKLNRKIFI